MRSSVAARARWVSAAFVLVALLLVARLYFLQIVHGEGFRREAMGQYVAQAPDTEKRASIFFSSNDGTLVSAAVMQTGWRIAIKPDDIGNASVAYTALSAATPIDHERFMAAAAKKGDPYEEVAARVDDAAAAKIRALKLPGVILAADQWRFYPGHELAAQAIGFVAFRGDRKTGVYGLERSWQDTLAENSSGLYINPFAEIFTNVEAALSADPSSHQGDVVTSIEPAVQKQLESTLDGVMKDYTPRVAGGIVMDPTTGRIVAMGVRPSFDPNEYNLETDAGVYGNPLVEGRYELGSIMKPLTVAAGIDSGAVTPATLYNDTGCITRSTMRICNFDHKARGTVPVQEVLSQSLNVGATFVEEKTGATVFTRYVRAYGLGDKTGIDLPNEVTGSLVPLGDGSGPVVNYAAASFGQGIAVSPIAMTRALSLLANHGRLPSPHVVTRVRFESGVVRSTEPEAGPQILKPETAETVTRMLVKVFDEGLLHGELRQEHYSIAAKTGTAQIASPNGGYYADRYLHSFFGYFPAHEPKFIVFLFVVEPHGVPYASASLAHPFMDVAQFLIHYYDIPPDR